MPREGRRREVPACTQLEAGDSVGTLHIVIQWCLTPCISPSNGVWHLSIVIEGWLPPSLSLGPPQGGRVPRQGSWLEVRVRPGPGTPQCRESMLRPCLVGVVTATFLCQFSSWCDGPKASQDMGNATWIARRDHDRMEDCEAGSFPFAFSGLIWVAIVALRGFSLAHFRVLPVLALD